MDNKTKEAAISFANTIDKQKEECPRGVMNPGLYYGFLAGAKNLELVVKALEKYRGISVYLEDGDTFVADEVLNLIKGST
jgi:hypothetical protein